MNEYEPSTDFVARVMRSVRVYEASQAKTLWIFEGFAASRPLRFAMSWCGLFCGIFLSPAVCL
jgi:hypothetical protein